MSITYPPEMLPVAEPDDDAQVVVCSNSECCLRAEIERLRDLVLTLIDNDPYAPIADNGMTVLDGWRTRARKELGIPF